MYGVKQTSFLEITRSLQKRKSMNQVTKKRIIETATDCFIKYGIKNTSMEQISDSLCISKRTLYQCFRSKRSLLEGCVLYRIEENKRQIEERNHTSGLESILFMNYVAYKLIVSVYPAFRRDIVKYEEVRDLLEKEYRAPLYEKCFEFFQKAKEEGAILKDAEFELAFLFFENSLLFLPANASNDIEQFTTYNYTLHTYLAGICTEQGRGQLKNISI